MWKKITQQNDFQRLLSLAAQLQTNLQQIQIVHNKEEGNGELSDVIYSICQLSSAHIITNAIAHTRKNNILSTSFKYLLMNWMICF